MRASRHGLNFRFLLPPYPGTRSCTIWPPQSSRFDGRKKKSILCHKINPIECPDTCYRAAECNVAAGRRRTQILVPTSVHNTGGWNRMGREMQPSKIQCRQSHHEANHACSQCRTRFDHERSHQLRFKCKFRKVGACLKY